MAAETGKMAETVKIALCQMLVTESKQENIANARKQLTNAASNGAKIAVLPECWNCPYDTKCFPEYAESLPDAPHPKDKPIESLSISMLREVAQATGMLVVGGSVPERADGLFYNTSMAILPDGSVAAKHRKVHLFDVDVPGGIRFKESDALAAGNSITVFTADGYPTIGIGICYDVRFPEVSMLAARQGARLLVYPGAFNMTTGPAHWELLLRARALDNQVYVAACSPARVEGASYLAWGHSTVVGPWGSVLATTDEQPNVVYADLDLGRVDVVRRAIPTTAQRRNDLYQLLTIEQN